MGRAAEPAALPSTVLVAVAVCAQVVPAREDLAGGGGARFSGGGYRGGYGNRGGGGAVVPGLIAGAVIGGALRLGRLLWQSGLLRVRAWLL